MKYFTAKSSGASLARLTPKCCTGGLLLCFIWNVVAQGPQILSDGIWTEIAVETVRDTKKVQDQPEIRRPEKYRVFQLNREVMGARLAVTTKGAGKAKSKPVEISLPMPDGNFARFQIEETELMAPALAAKFPEIKTYAGHGVDDPAASVRIDQTPHGFSAQILSPSGAVYIDPLTPGDQERSISYLAKDYGELAEEFHCHVGDDEKALLKMYEEAEGVEDQTGIELRTYRLAVATTGEYTEFHGGTVALGQAAVVTAINRVSGIFEVEFSIRFQLVANNDLLIYTNRDTDPYSNDTSSLYQNQPNIDSVIGDANYDIGHVFTTGSGGLGQPESAGISGQKAKGSSGGNGYPISDSFWVRIVAHEFGHQFGAHHTFNTVVGNCGASKNEATAYEPGSGSTIMSYASVCGSGDLQNFADPYFHSISHDNILYHVDNRIPEVGTRTATGNTAPVVNAGGDFTIPARTPFVLTATGSDPDAGDIVTFNWEERDLGPNLHVNGGDNGRSPIFRSWTATTDPARIFPRLSDLLENTTVKGETLPTTTRAMNFRAIARDNRTGGGGVATDDMVLNVIDTGVPFQVTAPNSDVTWTPGTLETITWDVAGTTGNGINAANVGIQLSTDGGLTYPIVLAPSTPNDGSHSIWVPNLGPDGTSQARVRIQALGNVFFDISNTDFSIAAVPGFTLTITPESNVIEESGSIEYTVQVDSVLGFTDPVALSLAPLPAGISGSFSVNPVIPGNTIILTMTATSAVPGGNYALDIQADGSGQTDTAIADLSVAKMPEPITLISPPNGGLASLTPTLEWSADPSPMTYTVEVDDQLSFSSPEFSGTTSTTKIVVGENDLEELGTYYWRVTAQNVTGSIVSETGSFNVVSITQNCHEQSVLIPDDDPVGISVTQTLSGPGRIHDLDLALKFEHSWIGDLVVTLEHVDTGTSVTLVDRVGGPLYEGNNLDVILDDEATVSFNGVEIHIPGERYYPGFPYGGFNPLSDFDGESYAGTWRLTVSDLEPPDEGRLLRWCLEMDISNRPDPPTTPDLTDTSDLGISNSDNVTRNQTPTFEGTAQPESIVMVRSGDAMLGTPTADASGNWTLTVESPLADGLHSITAEADGSEPSDPLTILIDTVPPSLTVNQASGQNDPVVTGPVFFTATFSEPVTGFATGDATTGGSSNPTTQAISEVEPNDGTTYQISVSGLEGDGNVKASISGAVAQDLAGNGNAASTSNDNSVVVISDLAPPENVQASDGEFSDKIRVTWNAVATAQTYDVYRIRQMFDAAPKYAKSFGTSTLIGSTDQTQFDDTEAEADPENWFYWVVAKKVIDSVTRTSPPSESDIGQRAVDRHGDDSGSATEAIFNGNGLAQFSGELRADDVDYFQITLTVPMVIRAYTTGSINTVGRLLDSNSQLLNDPDPDADGDAGVGTNFEIRKLLQAGTYYLEVSGYGNAQNGSYDLHLELARALLINEIDVDDEGDDDREFVELSDGGAIDNDLTGYVLVFFDGASDTSYLAIDLDGESTDEFGYFVAGNAGVSGGVDVIFPDDTLLDGTGAVALYEADETDFPNGSPVTTNNLVDAIVYSTDGSADDPELIGLLLTGEPQVNEDGAGNRSGHSLQRLPNFSGDPRKTTNFRVLSPTPGTENTLPDAPSVPRLTILSDSGESSTDGVTNVNLPTFTGTARAGSLVTISDLTGDLGSTPTDIDGNWSFTVVSALADESYSVIATADRHAGGGASLALPVVIDTQAPPIPTGLDLDPGSDSGVLADDDITNADTLLITGDELESGVIVTLNSDRDGDVGSAVAGTSWSIVTATLSESTHQLVARATDVAGNISADSPALAIQIDLTSPMVSIEQAVAQPDPAMADSFNFIAEFSEAVQGFLDSDVTVGGTAGASFVTLSGGPANFNVAVSGATREGTVMATIGAGVAIDTAGNPNVASTSVDNRIDHDLFDGLAGPATVLTFSGNTALRPGSLFAGDMDLFEFTLTRQSEITVKTTGSTGTRGSLFDISGNLLNDPDADATAGTNFSITKTLPPGTYRIDVEGKTGTENGLYELEITIDRELNMQPDLLIGKKPAAHLGQNIYNGTGAGQAIGVVSKKLKTAKFFGQIGNDGAIGGTTNGLMMWATRGNRHFGVTYFDASGNVTGAMVTGTRRKEIVPGANEAIRGQIKPSRKLKNRTTGKIKGKKITVTVTATSLVDPTGRDVVKAMVRTK